VVEILNYTPDKKIDLAWIRSQLPGSRIITVTERRTKKTKVVISPIDDTWKERAKVLGHRV